MNQTKIQKKTENKEILSEKFVWFATSFIIIGVFVFIVLFSVVCIIRNRNKRQRRIDKG